MDNAQPIVFNSLISPAIQSQFNILIVDDDEDDFFITSSLLNEIEHYRFTIEWIPTYKQALEQMKEKEFHLVLADYRLGAKTGADLIEDAVSSGMDMPIILLTGNGSAEIDRTAMEKGAYDYLIKSDISPLSLERSIRYAFTRHKGLKALQKSENKYRAMFENSKDAMFTLNEHFEILDVNSTALKMIGLPKLQVSCIAIADLFENKEELKKIVLEAADSKELLDREVELKTLDGRQLIGILTITAEKDAEGKFYYQGIFHDITELKKAEQANIIAEKFESTQRFVRMLAHEIRNPLNNILLSIDNFQEHDVLESPHDYTEIIKRNGLRINELISQLLESFKKVDIEQQEIVFNNLIQEALIAIADRVSLKGVSLRKQVDHHVSIKCDSEKLKLAIINFLVNAIEAMEDNKGILSITVKELSNNVCLIISDNGCGMTEEQRQRLFEPYFTTKSNGVGLGLSSSMAILRSHNANIEVESQPNKGTKFSIQFPKH